ncbi:hypothetical protein ACHAPT_001389 [Fusarium lateritium]
MSIETDQDYGSIDNDIERMLDHLLRDKESYSGSYCDPTTMALCCLFIIRQERVRQLDAQSGSKEDMALRACSRMVWDTCRESLESNKGADVTRLSYISIFCVFHCTSMLVKEVDSAPPCDEIDQLLPTLRMFAQRWTVGYKYLKVYGQHLHDALHILGKWEVLERAQDKKVILSKFPKHPQTETASSGAERQWASFRDEYVTGVCGKATTSAQGIAMAGNPAKATPVPISPGDYWEIRWDYDTAKGSHINVKVGGRGEHKFAAMFPPGDYRRGFETAPGYYFDTILDQSSTVGYYKGMENASMVYCAEALVKVCHFKTQDACPTLPYPRTSSKQHLVSYEPAVFLEDMNPPANANQPAPLELLPPEILLLIVGDLPSLDTLWDLLRASPATFRLFNSNALAITEGILSGPESILPPKVQELVRAVILVRSNTLPFEDLQEFQDDFMREMVPCVDQSTSPITLGPGTLSASNVSLPALRSVVATAYNISALSRGCLTSCLERLRALRPLHAFNPEPCYRDDDDSDGEPVRAWDREFIGIPAEVVDAGQSGWVEEMRAVRAMWTIQLQGEVECLAKAGTIGWSDADKDELCNLSVTEMVRDYPHHIEPEELKTVMEYLATGRDT